LKSLMRASVALLLPLAMLTAGCGGKNEKVAATVNGDPITEDEFNDRARSIGVFDLAPLAQMRYFPKSGEYAMQSLISEKILVQLAKEKKVFPSEADVNAAVPLAKKWSQWQQVTMVQPDPTRTEADWRRDVRVALIRRNIAAAPLKITDDEIKKQYDVLKGQLTPPDEYHLALIDVSSPQKANTALTTLKNVPFETVALTQSEDLASKPRQGDIGWMRSTTLPPDLLNTVKSLKPGEFAHKIVILKRPSPTTGKEENHYVIVKLIETKPGTPPTLDEVKPVAIVSLINQKDPSANQRVSEDVTNFRNKAKIEIKLKPYEHLLDKPAGQPGQPGQPPAGGQPGAPMPGTPGG
jgi:Parvulin-like peptidyl-prolyl isomerase